MNDMLMNRGESTEQATEEEQAAYEYLSTQAMDFIHSDKSANFVKNTIGQAKNPIDGVAKVTAVIIMRIEVQNEKNGGIPDEVKLEVAEDIVTELLELTITAGLIPQAEFEQNEEAILEQIVSKAYQEYMTKKEQSGQLNPEEEKANLMETVNSQEAKQGIGAMANEAAAQVNKMFGGQANG